MKLSSAMMLWLKAELDGENMRSKFLKAAQGLVDIVFREQQSKKRTAAHGIGHITCVAMSAKDYIEEMDGSEKVKEMAIFTGLFHDLIRHPAEVKGRKDGYITADFLRWLRDRKQECKECPSIWEGWRNLKGLQDVEEYIKTSQRVM